MEDHTSTIEVQPVPEFNWDKFDHIDWSGAYYIAMIVGGIWLFGIVCGLVGFFGGLWIFWILVLLFTKGFASILVNPLYCIFAPLVPTVISWVLLVGFSEVTMAPTRIYRKMTR